MREWSRVAVDSLCGGCGALIRQDSPAQFITIPGVTKKRIRCESCEGNAPPDLPARIVTSAPALTDWEGMRKLTKEFGGKIWKRG